MRTIVIIPARGGSKRLLKKNLKLLGGIPLIAHSILYAQANQENIDAIFVSTDDEKIKKIALRYGAEVIDRPKEISGDFEPTVSAIKHVLETDVEYTENIITLQPTTPFRPKSLFKNAFEIYKNGNYDSLFTVSRNYEKLGHIKNNKFIPFNYEIGQRSQDIEKLFCENGLLYISKRKLILENTIISKTAYPLLVESNATYLDIDTQDDFNYAEYLINKA